MALCRHIRIRPFYNLTLFKSIVYKEKPRCSLSYHGTVFTHICKHKWVHPTVRRCSNSNSFLEAASCSALYIGHEADTKKNSPVKLELDLHERFSDMEALERNVRARKINIDVYRMYEQYKTMAAIQERKDALTTARANNSKRMADIVKRKIPENIEERQQLKEELIKLGKAVREELKLVLEEYNEVEGSLVLDALQLPAQLHQSTPETDTVVKTWGEAPHIDGTTSQLDGAASQLDGTTSHLDSATSQLDSAASHLDIAQNAIFFNGQEPGSYYLCGELALSQRHIEQTAKSLLNEHGLLQLDCPAMIRKLVIEGCGLPTADPSQVFMVDRHGCDVEDSNAQMYLLGVSPQAFIAYVTMTEITRPSLPLKFYSTGSHYRPKPAHAPLSLLNVPQANVVELFGACETAQEMEALYDEYIELAAHFYRRYNVQCRVVRVGVEHLHRMECARTDVQVWMASTQAFVQVGKVAMWSDFASRRLTIHSAGTEVPLCTVHSTMVRIPTLLAAMLEHNQSASLKL